MVSANEWKMEPRILGSFPCTMWNQIWFICYYKTNQVMAPDWILLAQWGYWRCIMSDTAQQDLGDWGVSLNLLQKFTEEKS